MNRHQRRAARAEMKKALFESVVAYHEAGHAIARYLTAGMMGLSEEDSIDEIVIGDGGIPTAESHDGQAVLPVQATTYGRKYSMEIYAVRRDMDRVKGWTDLPPEEYAGKWNSFENNREMIETAREQGCDIERWLRVRATIAVGGAVGEAIYRKVPWLDVVNGYEARNDMLQLREFITMSGLSADELSPFATATATWLSGMIKEEPGAMEAFKALSEYICRIGTRSGGTISGEYAVGIIRRAMAEAR